MKTLFDHIVNWMIDQGEITREDKELYIYAIQSIVLTVSPIFLALAIGVVMRCPGRSVLVILPFALIRKFSGGYHAKSALVCLIASVMLIIGCVSLTYLLEDSVFVLVLTGFAIIGMGLLSPVDHENRRLSAREKRSFKITAIIITLVFYFSAVGFFVFKKRIIATCFCVGILLASILQYPAYIRKHREDRQGE